MPFVPAELSKVLSCGLTCSYPDGILTDHTTPEGYE